MLELLRGDRDVVRVGHRGAAALAPENTLAAIEAAAAHGVDVVEVDVLRGRGGGLVLAHGPEVPADAPPLGDALALVHRLGLAVQLDVKLPGIEGAVAEAVAACHELGAAVYVWTVNDRATAAALVEAGADGIITDDPRILAPF